MANGVLDWQTGLYARSQIVRYWRSREVAMQCYRYLGKRERV
jgi:hypothetical protein